MENFEGLSNEIELSELLVFQNFWWLITEREKLGKSFTLPNYFPVWKSFRNLKEKNNNFSKEKDNIKLVNKNKTKNIFLDDNIISKIFFIWNIKSTYFEKEKNVQE